MKVENLSRSSTHTMSKTNCDQLVLLKGLGIEGDAHMGKKVKHRSRVRANPDQPNLRQVHLIHAELHEELAQKGFQMLPGQMGENITTRGIDLLALVVGTKLQIGTTAIVEITGLRNPCTQLDGLQDGLMKAVLDKDEDGNLIRKAGVMGIVLEGGEISIGDAIKVEWPPEPHIKLDRV